MPPHIFSLFANDDFPPTNSLAFFAGADLREVERGTYETDGRKHFTPLVLGCILYRFPSDPTRYHQTRFIRPITRKDFERIGIEPSVISVATSNLEKLASEKGTTPTDRTAPTSACAIIVHHPL